MGRPPLAAALIDFGGTLVPDAGARPRSRERRQARVGRLREILPELDERAVGSLVDSIDADLLASQAGLLEHAEELIALRLGSELRHRASGVRAKLASVRGRREPHPGAQELLAGIGALGWRRVVVSNAALTPATEFWLRLRELGLADLVDGLVSSFDIGFRKPHPAMFEAALELAGCPAERCVMIGDSERMDIEPAAALGMRTICVCIDEPLNGPTCADEVASSLDEVLGLLQKMGGQSASQ